MTGIITRKTAEGRLLNSTTWGICTTSFKTKTLPFPNNYIKKHSKSTDSTFPFRIINLPHNRWLRKTSNYQSYAVSFLLSEPIAVPCKTKSTAKRLTWVDWWSKWTMWRINAMSWRRKADWNRTMWLDWPMSWVWSGRIMMIGLKPVRIRRWHWVDWQMSWIITGRNTVSWRSKWRRGRLSGVVSIRKWYSIVQQPLISRIKLTTNSPKFKGCLMNDRVCGLRS